MKTQRNTDVQKKPIAIGLSIGENLVSENLYCLAFKRAEQDKILIRVVL